MASSSLRLAHQGALCMFSIIQSFHCGHVLNFLLPLNTYIAALECHGTLATLVSCLSAIMSRAASWDLVLWGGCEPGAGCNFFFPPPNQKSLRLAISCEKHFIKCQRPALSITLFIALLHNKLLHAWWKTAGEEVCECSPKSFLRRH